MNHTPHPRIAQRLTDGPPTTRAVVDRLMPQAVNRWLAVHITGLVSTMWTAYAFAALSLVALPAAIASRNPVVIVSWVSQTFLQLVFLPIITVGQSVQAEAADARAKATFDDVTMLVSELGALRQQLTPPTSGT